MNSRKTTLTLLLAGALLLQACGGLNTADAVATGVAQTVQISQLETAAAGGGQQQATSAPESTQLPESTPTSTLEPTSSIPYVSVSENTNCRTGPSANYGYVTTINVGQQLEVLKVFNTANYVVVRNPSGAGDCWLWLQYATPANFAQYDLPVATQPPTPTPTFTPTPAYSWEGAWTSKVISGNLSYEGPISFTVVGNTITGSGSWAALPYSFTGTLSANGQQASGTWTTQGNLSGPWSATIKGDNLNQFMGNLGPDLALCGWRGGAGEPSPCKWP